MGERVGKLGELEFAQCFDAAPSMVARSLPASRHVVDVWEQAQWVRVRDFRNWAGVKPARIVIWKKRGLITPDHKPWYPKTMVMRLDEAMFLKKCLLLVPYARKATGAFEMQDMEAVASLPLETLLGLMTHPRMFSMLFSTCGGWGTSKKGGK
ncbi:MAG: hypothetical protein ACYC63_04755 [Armatimonadota bacterium]